MGYFKVKDSARLKLVETLCILDDAKRFGWNEGEYEKVEAKLVEVINLINISQN
jgi:hypothetical protein